MNDFKSTWLMIKQHKVTGLKYFCKTALYDPVTYLGSGTYWGRHLAEHGPYVDTLWYQLFDDKEEIMNYALTFSKDNNIVDALDENGRKVWANLIPENGIDGGGNLGMPMLQKQKDKLSDTWEVVKPDGTVLIVKNMRQFCIENKLNASAMSALARGKRGTFKGYKCRKLTNNRNVKYEHKEYNYLTDDEKKKINSEAVKQAKKEKATPKIKYNGVTYNSLVEATEATGKSRYLLIKDGELLRKD
jgi:hypothetical protein